MENKSFCLSKATRLFRLPLIICASNGRERDVGAMIAHSGGDEAMAARMIVERSLASIA